MTAAILRRHGLRTGTYLSPHLVSFTERVRIDDARRRRPSASPRPSSARARAAEKVDRTLGRRRPRHAVRGPHGGRLRRAGRAPACRSPSIEAGLGGRYDATNVIPSRGAGADQRRPRAHALAGADGRRHRARRSSTSCGRAATLVVGRRPASRRAGAGASARAPSAARGWSVGRGRSRRRSSCWRAAPSSGATSRSPARRPRRYLGALDEDAVRRGGGLDARPGPLRGRRRTRRTTVLDGAHNPAGMAALAEALRGFLDGRRAGGLRLDPRRQGRRGDAARAAAAVRRGRLHRQRQPARAAARRRCSRCAASSAARRRAPSATRAARWRWRARPRGPDGVALATGSIYLIADLLRPAGAGGGARCERRRPVRARDDRRRRGHRRARDPRVLRARLRVRPTLPVNRVHPGAGFLRPSSSLRPSHAAHRPLRHQQRRPRTRPSSC